MPIAHPLLHAANRATLATKSALARLLAEVEKEPTEYLCAIAVNLWSPFLPSGRHTELGYPPTSSGKRLYDEHGGETRLARIHHRYLTLFGRNLSANHLLIEVENVGKIVVDSRANTLKGPTPSGNGQPITLYLNVPLRPLQPRKHDSWFQMLVPQEDYPRWIGWLKDDEYERRHAETLREELLKCRTLARSKLPSAFRTHLTKWLQNEWIPENMGLAGFDDRWLARIQLTALASAIWGDIWISHTLSLGGSPQRTLALQASCTVSGRADVDNKEDLAAFREHLSGFAENCAARFTDLVEEEFRNDEAILTIDHEPRKPDIADVANKFSGTLGGSLIDHKHEGEPIRLRGLLTAGLDALRLRPTEVTVIHDFDKTEFEPLNAKEDEWTGLWRAYFVSNDLFLGRDGIVLHFELALTHDGSHIIPIPRHVLRIDTSLEALLVSAGTPINTLLHLGFETEQTIARHLRTLATRQGLVIDKRVQIKGEDKLSWGSRLRIDPDWANLTEVISGILSAITTSLHKKSFFKNAAISLSSLSPGQITQLADGVAEVARLKRGCLVFIGPVVRRDDDTYWILDPRNLARRLEITSLGVCFSLLSQLPDKFSHDFRDRFADSAALDGETVVFTGAHHPVRSEGVATDRSMPVVEQVDRDRTIASKLVPEGFADDRLPGTVESSRFIHLPDGTPSLLELRKPQISESFLKAWEKARQQIQDEHLPQNVKGIRCRSIHSLDRTDLLCLGTRHRKAAMTTVMVDSVVAITCSESGRLMVWVGGVPIAEVVPQADRLLPHLTRPPIAQQMP